MNLRSQLHLGLALLFIAAAGAAGAATWRVGAGGPLPTVAQALQQAADGDVIEVMPGTYFGDVAVITQRRLTIRGVGERPVFVANGQHAEGKAIWVVRDGAIHIENIEFRGARVPDGNGAGIRFERGQLSLLRCAFFDNEMGVLTANFGDATLRIEGSEFGQAPPHEGGLHHLLYVGRIAHFELTGSRFHQGHLGHLIKSRARVSLITANRIDDGPLGRASYEIDLPNGGLVRISDNTIARGPRPENATLVAFGAEGQAWPESALTVQGNTFVNPGPAAAHFVRVWPDKLPARTPVLLKNNRLRGPGRFLAGPGAVLQGNGTASAGAPAPLHISGASRP